MRKYLLILGMAILPISVVNAHGTCDAGNEGKSRNIVASPDFDFEDGDLVAEDGFEDVMRITPDGDLYIHEEKVEVTGYQRELLVNYYQNVEGITDEAIDLGVAAAKFGVRTAVSAVFMALTMDDDEADEFERKVEAEAEQFEKFAEGICSRVEALVKIETELLREIPSFIPMMRHRSGQSI